LLGIGRQQDHEALYWEYHGLWDGAQAVRMGDWKGVRLGGHSSADAPIELYNLSSDLGETSNVSADHPAIIERIAEVMAGRTESEIPGWNFPVRAAGN
jgi:arylsulfatase A-like enzyme